MHNEWWKVVTVPPSKNPHLCNIISWPAKWDCDRKKPVYQLRDGDKTETEITIENLSRDLNLGSTAVARSLPVM